MRFNRLDLNLLVALDHLLTLRSVSDAAAKMNMTQPAMSNALLRLREYFNDDLLVRIGRRLEPTPRGEALKSAVRDVLVRVEWTIGTAADFDPLASDRRFNILVSDYTLATLIPKLLARCQASAPGVRFNFLHQIDGPERLLERGDVDLLIIPTDFSSRLHPFEVILEEEFCVIAWSEGKFAKQRLTKRAFQQASHVVTQPPGGAPSLEAVFLKQFDFVRRADVTTHSFNTMPHLVAGSDRIATMHRRLAEQAAKALPIKILPSPYPLPKMRQAMQWHKHRSQDAGLIWLRKAFRDSASDAAPVMSLPRGAEVRWRGDGNAGGLKTAARS